MGHRGSIYKSIAYWLPPLVEGPLGSGAGPGGATRVRDLWGGGGDERQGTVKPVKPVKGSGHHR